MGVMSEEKGFVRKKLPGEDDIMVGVETTTTTTNRRVGMKVARRVLHEERKQALVAGAMSPDVEFVPHKDVLGKFRSPKAFMEAARQYLDPDEIGPAFAKRFKTALDKGELGMLKLMLPYVFGAPDKMEENQDESAFSAVLEALSAPRNKGGRRKPAELVVLSEEEQSDDQREGSYGREDEQEGE